MFAPIPEIVEELKEGKFVVLVDDENRENEGDLVLAAEKVTPGAINFMARYGRGLICLALTNEKADRLKLPLMVQENTSKFGTAFTVSIDAASGISTGISAYDRAQTILTAIDENCKPEDLVRPGHIFPLRARDGGVLVRSGQTEGSVDLMRIAGLKPAAVICEIMNEDGTMARLPQLTEFCKAHGIKLCSVADIINYRRHRERLIERIVSVKLPTRYGQLDLHLYRSKIDEYLHIALCAGGIGTKDTVYLDPVLVRVHSECLTGDIFGSLRCDCGDQLQEALSIICREGKGVLLYIRQEGRGIGLIDKLRSYALQEKGVDTVDANAHLGLPSDLREYGIGAQILLDLGIRRMRLLTNNPRKIVSISGYGLEVVERIPIEITPTKLNRDYLRAKRDKLGHLLQRLETHGT
jgi:3,4-dihydroxy 2-butanone 4-phosphate synthase/GTP cyclohydrolase II